MTTRLLLNSPLINYILYKDGPNAGTIADGSTIGFYADSNHTVKQDVYKDAEGTVLYENPITLPQGQVPPIYMQNKIYYIEILDKNDGLIETIDDYVPNGGSGSSPTPTPTAQPSNFIANGQFTYYYDFSIAGDGSLDGSNTFIAPSWQFLQDAKTTTSNKITFPSVANQGFNANPINGFNINSESPQSGETLKDLVQEIGSANTYEGEEITLAFEAINNAGTSASIEVILTKNYGVGGSASESVTIKTETLTSSFAQYVINYTMPSNSGKTIGDGSFLNITFRFPLGSTCNITMANILGLPGNVAKPTYPELAYSDYLAKTFGNMFNLVLASTIDEKSNYNSLDYINGQVHADQYYPQIALFPIGKQPPNWVKCVGTSYKPNDDVIADALTFNRLDKSIGQMFGGGGDLIVTGKDNVMTFTVKNNAPKSPTTAGNMGSKITIKTVKKAFLTGVKATVSGSVVTLTWQDDTFTPNATPASFSGYAMPIATGWIGDWFNPAGGGFSPGSWVPSLTKPLSVSVTSPGPNAAATVTFASGVVNDYLFANRVEKDTINPFDSAFNTNFFEWVSSDSSTRAMAATEVIGGAETPVPAANHILFSVDGKTGGTFNGAENTITVPLKSSFQSAGEIASAFADAINTDDVETITINTAPAASDYFKKSSADIDYVPWYRVDGAGTPPSVTTETLIPVDITSGDSTTIVQVKTVAEINNYEFKVPNQSTQLPEIPADGTSLVAYYIKA